MGLAGIPWWTTDIGGFQGGNVNDPAFQELLIRWFQWGVFCPVMRLHGYREPQIQPSEPWRDGIAQCNSGAPNEVWSYGEENYELMKNGLFLREKLRPYISRVMQEAHEKGDPVMRTMFYQYPDQAESWQVEDQYMLGADILVAPVLYAGQRERTVWLPAAEVWVALNGERYPGGSTITVATPLEGIPVFVREGVQVQGEIVLN